MVVCGVKGEARTQKARGVIALWEVAPYNTFPWVIVAQGREEVGGAFALARGFAGGRPIFARPCPIRPRHGFVESRAISSLEEAQALWDELERADPEGELMLVPLLHAKYNAIFAPGVVVVGPGHDGATSGRNAISLPLPSSWVDESKMAGLIAPGEVPYIEGVLEHGKHGWVLTQYRSGPPPTAGDYIPERVRVERVVRVDEDMDLLEWERLVKSLSKGAVVYHPGGSAASHFGAHCIACGVPYLTSKEPRVGEVLEPTNAGWGRRESDALAEAIREAFEREDTEDDLLPLSLALVHSIGAYVADNPSEEAIKLLGWAIVYLARACAGASLGELRYSPRRPLLPVDVPAGGDRDDIYADALKFGIEDVIRCLAIAKEDFSSAGWSRGYGGRRWANASSLALSYVRGVVSFLNRPSRGALGGLMRKANRLLHAVHNNGWYLNKWPNITGQGSDWVRDMAAQNPGRLAVSHPKFIEWMLRR